MQNILTHQKTDWLILHIAMLNLLMSFQIDWFIIPKGPIWQIILILPDNMLNLYFSWCSPNDHEKVIKVKTAVLYCCDHVRNLLHAPVGGYYPHIIIILDERKNNIVQTVVSSVLILCGEAFNLHVDVIVDRLLGWTSALPGLLIELHDWSLMRSIQST